MKAEAAARQVLIDGVRTLPMTSWSGEMVQLWLANNGFANLTYLFEENNITGIGLKSLTDRDLRFPA